MTRNQIRVVLVILTLISIYGILVRMGLAPSLFRSSLKCDQISETLTSLALSFVAAEIFYAVTVVLPEYVNRKKAYNGLMPLFENVYSDMSYLIGALMMMANITKSEETVEEGDWEPFVFSTIIKQNQWFVHSYSFKNSSNVHNHIRGWVSTEHDFLKKIKTIKKNIERINMSPLSRGLPLETMDLLNGIHQSNAVTLLESVLSSRQIRDLMISPNSFKDGSPMGFPKDMNEMLQLHLELRNLCDNPVDHRFELMSEDEIINYTQERNTILSSIPNSAEMQHIDQIEEAVMNGMRIL